MIRDRKYLDWLRTQRCIISGRQAINGWPVDPMHIGTAGKGLKAGDDATLPVAHDLHREAHQHGEMSMFRDHLPDIVLRRALRALARELYQEYLAELPQRGGRKRGRNGHDGGS